MMPSRKHLFTSSQSAAAVFGLNLRAGVKLPAVFADHMVLQREQPIPVWAWPNQPKNQRQPVAPTAVTAETTADQNGQLARQTPAATGWRLPSPCRRRWATASNARMS